MLGPALIGRAIGKKRAASAGLPANEIETMTFMSGADW
jgi:hypothetical protein